MISIIIPVYNQADKLKRCLVSIKNQTYFDYEIIIVDDGSVDDDKLLSVFEWAKPMFGNKFKTMRQHNQGAPVARNNGFKESSGEYLLFCDADMVLEPIMLAEMANVLREKPQVSYVYSGHKFGTKVFRCFDFSAERLRDMPYIHTSSLIRREHFPGFDESVRRLQDWDLWLTMLKQGHVGFRVNKILFSIEDGGTMSSWLPSFAYKLFPFLPKVKKYKEAVRIIKKKHKLK